MRSARRFWFTVFRVVLILTSLLALLFSACSGYFAGVAMLQYFSAAWLLFYLFLLALGVSVLWACIRAFRWAGREKEKLP